MADQDKVRRLAEDQAAVTGVGGFKAEVDRRERILREGLKTLLDAVDDVCECADKIGNNSSVIKWLAAELKGWQKE